MPITAFRFFTVYGPWGRPDMALFKFTAAALEGGTIDVYNHGRMERDFTYIDDLIEAIMRLVPAIPVAGEPVAECDSLSPVAPFRVVNIGNGAPVSLLDFIAAIEAATGRPLARNYLPMQPGRSRADLGRCDPARSAHRLPPPHARRQWRAAIRGLVPRVLRASDAHAASWKMTPSVNRSPLRTRLTPCRRLTRYVPRVPCIGRSRTGKITASP